MIHKILEKTFYKKKLIPTVTFYSFMHIMGKTEIYAPIN